MKFALVNNDRVEASPYAKGTCPGCGDPVIAKCGKQKIEHWAHKGSKTCDPWWEPETEWHRSWKAHFQKEQQEVRHQDPETQEWHIADVKMTSGIVLEFQHSAISPEEIQSREAFYRDMIWIVDATRLKRTIPKLDQAFHSGKQWQEPGYRAVTTGLDNIPLEFRNSKHVVLFDSGPDQPFYCLLPGRVLNSGTMINFLRHAVVDHLKTGSHFIDADQTQAKFTSAISMLAEKLNVPVSAGVDVIHELLNLKAAQEVLSKHLARRGLFTRR